MKIVGFIFLIAASLIVIYFLARNGLKNNYSQKTSKPTTQKSSPATNTTIPQETVIATRLQIPWAVSFLPDGGILVTERPGRIRLIDKNGILKNEPLLTLPNVKATGEGGLLGITLHPNFSSNHYVYIYYTYNNNNENTLNRVARLTYKNNILADEHIIVDKIPGASNHNGGRIKFGPDNYLYIGTGDAENPSEAQNTKSPAGKILRVTDEGKAPPSNPFNNLIYSYGHRNVQGLAWDAHNNLWATEHGRSGTLSGLDELNLIKSGKNYGWPIIQGDQTRPGMETPKRNSGAFTTWAPSGASFLNNSLFFGGLRGQTLYEAVIENNQVLKIKEHFRQKYGRIREVIQGPDNMLYITTSNRDGRGNPADDDDKMIRINPVSLK